MTTIRPGAIEAHLVPPSGEIPNNPRLPLLVYRGALPLEGDPARRCEELFAGNGWGGGWRNGIYPYHHFHGTAHEALGIARGEAQVRFGGPEGVLVAVKAGDIVVIPAGVAHKSEAASRDLLVIGAYPEGQAPDLRKPEPGKAADAAAAVERVPLPAADPAFGRQGPLTQRWTAS